MNPFSFGFAREMQAVATAEGLVVVMAGNETDAAFVSTGGDVMPLRDYPYHEGRPDVSRFSPLGAYAVPVPGTRKVWVVSSFGAGFGFPDDSRSEVVLYEIRDGGWYRLASATSQWVMPAAATAAGDLIGASRPGAGAVDSWLTLRADAGGEVELIRVPVAEPGLEAYAMWELDDGDIAVLTAEPAPPPAPVGTHNTFLRYYDLAWRPTRPTVFMSPLLSSGQGAVTSAVATIQRPSGDVTQLYVGRSGSLDGELRRRLFVQRISANGDVLFDPPGVEVVNELNPVDALGAESTPVNLGVLDEHVDAVVWQSFPEADGTYTTLAHRVDFDGGLLEESPLLLDARDAHVSGAFWALDGTQRAYLGGLPLLPVTGDTIVARGMNLDLGFDWTTVVQGCEDRLGHGAIRFVGAVAGGLWIVWEDWLQDSTSARFGITKVSLVRADGSFAWNEP